MNGNRLGEPPNRLRQAVGACALGALIFAVVCMSPGAALSQVANGECSFENFAAAGPFDYRTQRGALHTVERRHFTPKVEQLRAGESTSKPGPDIAYTLSWFPNHHRALASLSRLAIQMNTNDVPGMRHSVSCYFERAVRFRPDDTVARLIYARHLGRTNSANAASRQLALSASYAKDNPLTHYNIGMVAFELKDYDSALKHAHIAYGAGVPSPELREWLTKEGKWVEPALKGSLQAASPGSAASAPPSRGTQ